jgi:hypothetical protein
MLTTEQDDDEEELPVPLGGTMVVGSQRLGGKPPT